MNGHGSVTTLPPLTMEGAKPGGGVGSVAAAQIYKSEPTELVASLQRPHGHQIEDRTLIHQQRQQQQQILGLNPHQSHERLPGLLVNDEKSEVVDYSSILRPASGTGLRIPTPVPDMRRTSLHHTSATRDSHRAFGVIADESHHINLHLPSPTGSQSARTVSSNTALSSPTSSSIPHPPFSPSSLASITQDTNHRVATFLRHYGHHRADSATNPTIGSNASQSHRLLLWSSQSPKEIQEEKEVNRLLNSWHPQKSSKNFTALSNKIKHIIAERVSLFEGHFSGKTLVEDGGFVTEELEKKRYQYFKIMVPNNITIVKIDLDVTVGRVDMFVTTGEPWSSKGDKDGSSGGSKSWNMRATVGHHNLTIHGSDPNFKNGEYFFITLYALQTSTIQIKVTLGGKNKILPISSVNTDDNGPGGPASSGTRLTARQAGATRHAPSTRNIRRMLEARVKSLSDDPKALKAFLAKVGQMKRGGVPALAGSEKSNSIHPPTHLSVEALHRLNEQEAAADAITLQSSEMTQSQRRKQSRKSQSKPQQLLAPKHPRPLTHESLDFIAHIQSIPGVAYLFYEVARELRNPPILDENDFIIYDASAPQDMPPSSPPLSSPSSMRGRSRETGTDLTLTIPQQHVQFNTALSSPSASTGPTPLSSPSSAGGNHTNPSQSPTPVLDRRLSLSSTLKNIVQRICKRIKYKVHQLESTHPHLCPQPHETTPPSTDAVIFREQIHFYHRCLTIYQAHLSEIETLLQALATGDRSQPHLARFLSDTLPPRNFLLSNAFDATENKRFDPIMARERKKRWLDLHNQKMMSAEQRHLEHLQAKKDQTLYVISKKENDRAIAIAHRQAIFEQQQLQKQQQMWLVYIAGALRHCWLHQAKLNLRPMRIESFRKNVAAKKIQLFIRASLAIKRKTRASLHFQAFRSMVLLMASNYGAVKRDRAANCIKLFIEQKKGVDSVSRLVKNFRRRVAICQRSCRRWLQTKRAKIYCWRRQYAKAVIGTGNQALVEDHQLRDHLLLELFDTLKRRAMDRQQVYLQEMAVYRLRLDEEQQKKRIITDHILDLPPTPLRPKIPLTLNQTLLMDLMDAALQANKTQAVKYLQNTADQEEYQPTSTSSSSPPSTAPLKSPRNGGGSMLSSKRAKSRPPTTDTLKPESRSPGSSGTNTPMARSRTGSTIGLAVKL